MTGYTGRFAPTPSGELHLGSLVAAVGSYLAAKSAGGTWLIRIDDLDRPRIRAGSEDKILSQLEAHGMQWDRRVYRQSEHLSLYREGLRQLETLGLTYACTCSRKRLWQLLPERGPAAYPGFCRELHHASTNNAIRLNTEKAWHPIKLGKGEQVNLHDFVIRRRDGIMGYDLACAIDEGVMGITHVVRGTDLAQSTKHQKIILRQLDAAIPLYAELPLVQLKSGEKLSKSRNSPTLNSESAASNLKVALRALGQLTNETEACQSPEEILRLATQCWRPHLISTAPYVLG